MFIACDQVDHGYDNHNINIVYMYFVSVRPPTVIKCVYRGSVIITCQVNLTSYQNANILALKKLFERFRKRPKRIQWNTMTHRVFLLRQTPMLAAVSVQL